MALVKQGQSGDAVRELQQWLQNNGFDPGTVDGVFGSKTLAAVKAFQTAAGVSADGVVGDETRGAMDSYGGATATEGEDTPQETTQPNPDDSPAASPEGSTATIPGIMAGGTLTKVTRQDQDDVWLMIYKQGGIDHAYSFDSYESMLAALGQDAVTSGTYGFQQITEGAYDAGLANGSIFGMGPAAPLVGQSGSYANMYADVTRDAAIAAGSRNPGALGNYLSDPEVSRLIAAATAGGWTPEQLQAEIRNTGYYQNVMYPGISVILDQGVQNPEAAWREYSNSVEKSLDYLGYEKDADGSYKSTIGRMLEQGISDYEFNTMAPSFQRAKESPDFAVALDYWLDQTAGRNVTFDDVFDAMSGQATGDLEAAVEKAVIQYQSTRTNTILTPEQISRIANKTNLSEAEIATSFTSAEENLLALGSEGLSRYGLSEDDLVSAAFGLQSQTGKTASEIRRTANKTMKEIGLQDNKKAQFYAGFDDRGVLQKPGLTAVAPEGG